uniref:SSD domain-containing protein n=1 Tax=Angiostrongylus cantonensis TaxID=6313 RepID=A0A0K0D3A2_ANGCA
LSYPVLYLFNRPKDIGNVIYGVDVKGEKNEIQGARVLTLHWFYPGTSENDAAYYQYRDTIMDFWKDVMKVTDFEIIPHNDKAMDDEMMKIIETTVPFAVPATVMLMFYVVFANWSFVKHKSKPLEMYLGVWTVILALICTFGIFFWFGAAFNPVTSTMPFLVLAVGIDDDFLMIAAWREIDRRVPVHQKIALVMADAGASITVTSFTNFFCFALGYYMCSTPAVSEFCLITAWAVLIDYLMQVTIFAAILCYSGRKEDTGGLASCCYKKEVFFVKDLERKIEFVLLYKTVLEILRSVPYMHKFFGERFAPFILRNDVRVVSWILFAAYTCVALYGCCKLKVDISPVKYIRDNSPIQTFVKLADKYIWADNVMPRFHVMNPPDLRDTAKRSRLNEVVFRLEHTNYSIGRVSTNFWMWQYQQYLNDFPDIDYQKDFYNKKYLKDFFSQIDYSQYRPHVKILDNVTNGEPCISMFIFETSFYGLDSWDKRQRELFKWRAILDEYPEFDMFLAGIFSPFLIDQRHTIAPSSMQTIGSALAMMALISFFFLPDAQSVFLMTWSLLSISMGVCGGLAVLGSDLDSVSMGCIVMAIGLAVDYSVHICYRYHRSEFMKSSDKVRDTMSSVGWPITQAVTSTLFGLVTTAFVPAYLVRVFFQTVYLVNIIGLTHALVWLPQLVAALDPCERVPLRTYKGEMLVLH